MIRNIPRVIGRLHIGQHPGLGIGPPLMLAAILFLSYMLGFAKLRSSCRMVDVDWHREHSKQLDSQIT